MDIIEKITNIQTEVAEVEKFIDEGELKKTSGNDSGVERMTLKILKRRF